MASALMPIGSRASSERGDERARRAATRRISSVAPHAPQASVFACSSTSSSIAGVSLPGERVLLARVKAAEQRPRLAVGHRAVAELRLRPRRPARRRAPPAAAGRSPTRSRRGRARRARRAAARPRARATSAAVRALVRRRQVRGRRAAHRGDHVRAAQRAARRRARPTPPGWRSPARCSAANRKSPERSPVKIRPVRLPPCAAGASPRISTRAAGSPKPGHRPAPVVLVAKRRPLLARDLLAPLDEAGAAAARRRPPR